MLDGYYHDIFYKCHKFVRYIENRVENDPILQSRSDIHALIFIKIIIYDYELQLKVRENEAMPFSPFHT